MAKRGVSASTQNRALNAIVFLYQQVLGIELGDFSSLRARRSRHVPVVLTPGEVRSLLSMLRGPEALQAGLLYGCGLRMSECLNLRIKDVDAAAGVLTVRGGKGGKDRMITLPAKVRPAPEAQLGYARGVHERDRAAGLPGVFLPMNLAEKAPSWAVAWE